MRIPLRAAYTGLTFLPWIALARSDIAPLLILHADCCGDIELLAP